ncbi:MAG TPA: PH domain-containing protein [Pirellulales bacterium]|nr:PH domain-containing protein [Pirellulales bacterium]
MKQAIAGVVPPETGEVTIMSVWPSVAALAGGRFWGQLYGIGTGVTVAGVPITVGRIIALLSIPLVLPIYFLMLLPCLIFLPKMGPIPRVYVSNPWARRYRLTNRRVIVERISGEEDASVSLDNFDAIQVVVLPGQEWYPAGELLFRKGNVETFRLSGVPRPETFRQTCLKAQRSHATVKKAVERQPVAV